MVSPPYGDCRRRPGRWLPPFYPTRCGANQRNTADARPSPADRPPRAPGRLGMIGGVPSPGPRSAGRPAPEEIP
ncbi:hypothetical protein GCM10009844_09620 [Nocardioides koreensis]|uniref:Uncharacterized protein n=1 Tax=Nocardioides koreensis TaxID=433651 RepID=A0ABN2ZCN7_9ACTN